MSTPRRPQFDIEPLDESSAQGRPDRGTSPAAAEPEGPADSVVTAGEFTTAASALVFAGSLRGIDEIEFGHEEVTATWWVAANLALPVARELIVAAGGRLWIYGEHGLLADRGWGDHVSAGATPRSDVGIVNAAVLEVIRAAGLHPVRLPASTEVAVLAPAARLAGVVQRAMDLGLSVAFRLLQLDPLFGGADDPRTVTELRLTSSGSPVPEALITALDRDPCVLVCRRPAEALLVQHGLASPLPDSSLAVLATRAGGWLLADAGFGSARFRALGPWQEAPSLVRLADHHRLVDIDAWASPSADENPALELPPLRLVRARTPVAVDAALLTDEDLDCLQALLEGRPLADMAHVVSGRDRHLLLAAGGLLERLPVGEPLYRLGPGPLYLPVGYRMQPILPPLARAELLMVEADVAVVLDTGVRHAFPLQHREPVWLLWAGVPPAVHRQLPADSRAALIEVDRLVTPTPPPAEPPPPEPARTRLGKIRERLREGLPPSSTPLRTWRDDARDAELADDFEKAASLFERNGDLLRAGHMYELAARRDAERSGRA